MRLCATAAICFLTLTGHAYAQSSSDYFLDSVPQANSDTCQSYSIVLALAHTGHGDFPLHNAEQLRVAELKFRKWVNNIAATDTKRSPAHHEVWAEALEQYVDKRFRLKREYLDFLDWLKRVGEITGSKDVSIQPELAAAKAKRVAMTSVEALGGTVYGKQGHIVSVLAIDGAANASPVTAIFFNSAIRGPKAEKRACSVDDLPGDYRYHAGLVKTNSYTLKAFEEGKHFLMWLEKN